MHFAFALSAMLSIGSPKMPPSDGVHLCQHYKLRRAYSLKASTSFSGVKKAPTLGTIRFSRLRLGSCSTEDP